METQTKKTGYVAKYLLTITASSIAETVTFPLDMIKTRLQIQGQVTSLNRSVTHSVENTTEGLRHQDTSHHHARDSSRIKYRGVMRTAIGIVKEEGVLKLWKGLSPAVLRHCIYSGCRMTFYEIIRDRIFKRNKDGTFPLWKAVPTGLIAGAGGQFLASPTDRVKVILQMEGRRILDGHKPSLLANNCVFLLPFHPLPLSYRTTPSIEEIFKYRGTLHAFTSIARNEGIWGLWKGWGANCTRSALVCLGDLTTYDAVKQRLLKHSSLEDTAITHAISSVCSSMTSALFGTPADVIKSRMMNQPYNEHGVGLYYKSTINCLMTTIKGEGFLALYKGLLPIWTRMAPWSMTFWLVYEQIRVLAGIGNF